MRRAVFLAFLSAIVWGLAGHAGAEAASFDCARAATAVEKAVCANPDLSKLDDEMAAAYAKVRQGLSAPARAEVLAGQRSWLDYVARACTPDAQPLAGAYDSDGLDCLKGLYRDRIETLDRPLRMGGRQFYPFDRYGALKDPEAAADSYWKVATKVVTSLRLDGNTPLARGFNAFMSKQDGPALKDMPGKPDADHSTDNESNFGLLAVTPRRISVSEAGSFYGHGAAHPNGYGFYHHYLVRENRPLVAADIFRGPSASWVKLLKPQLIAVLKQSLDPGALWDDLSDIDTTIANPDAWDFTTDGFGVQFQPYEVAAYVYGAPMAVLPYKDIESLLAPGARAIIGYERR